MKMVVERVRAVLYNSRAKGNVLGGPLKDRTAREGMAVLREEVSASVRSRAGKEVPAVSFRSCGAWRAV